MKSHGNTKIILKYIRFPHSPEDGFTLIEVILFLVILAVVGAMAMPYFQTTFLNSTEPLLLAQEQFLNNSEDPNTDEPGLLESIERVIADYKATGTTDERGDFKTNIATNAKNYDTALSKNDFSISNITDTGTSLTFMKVVVRKNNQRIMAFFPIY